MNHFIYVAHVQQKDLGCLKWRLPWAFKFSPKDWKERESKDPIPAPDRRKWLRCTMLPPQKKEEGIICDSRINAFLLRPLPHLKGLYAIPRYQGRRKPSPVRQISSLHSFFSPHFHSGNARTANKGALSFRFQSNEFRTWGKRKLDSFFPPVRCHLLFAFPFCGKKKNLKK